MPLVFVLNFFLLFVINLFLWNQNAQKAEKRATQREERIRTWELQGMVLLVVNKYYIFALHISVGSIKVDNLNMTSSNFLHADPSDLSLIRPSKVPVKQ